MDDPFRRPAFSPALAYADPRAALDFLERAFGFVRSMVITDPGGTIVHAEMRYGDGLVMVGGEWDPSIASPANTAGKVTQVVHVVVTDDLAGHCERARAAGAVILMEPTEQFYGDLTYRARDPEGHLWTFGQVVRAVSREAAEQASGLTIEGWV